jgi:hypothetical protein
MLGKLRESSQRRLSEWLLQSIVELYALSIQACISAVNGYSESSILAHQYNNPRDARAREQAEERGVINEARTAEALAHDAGMYGLHS